MADLSEALDSGLCSQRWQAMDARKFCQTIERTIRRYHLLERGARVGVAVSGGPDSVALLAALRELQPRWDLTLMVAHVDHGLRQEARQDREMVEGLCQRWNLPCAVCQLSPGGRKSGVEVWAREERYRFFAQVKEAYGLNRMALGHTQDDQAETVLFRLLRGSGRNGLGGIPPVRDGWLIRPLLACSRREVLAYLAERGLPSATDSTNADTIYTRNRIRHLLLPLLEREFSPQVRQHLAHLADLMRDEEALLVEVARGCLARVQKPCGALSIPHLRMEPDALRMRVVRMWLLENIGRKGEISFAHVARVLDLLDSGPTTGRLDLPYGLRVVREYDSLWKERQTEGIPVPYVYTLFPGEELVLSEAGWHINLSVPVPWQGRQWQQAEVARGWQALFDIEALAKGIIVRSFQPGDRICPRGMTGHKKVKRVFIDAKVPPAVRRTLPLVVAEKEVVWVPGHLRSKWGEVTPQTKEVCTVTVKPLPGKRELC
jgi:tRNA(Ile)-lysidine synthase